jgi:hypothetical protein
MPLAEQLTGWKKKFQSFSDSLPSLGMRTQEEEDARQKRLKQAKDDSSMQPTPKRWEQPSTGGEQRYQPSETKKARKERGQ